jgi:hypothetical protein
MLTRVRTKNIQQERLHCFRHPRLDLSNMRLPQRDRQTDAERSDDGGCRPDRKLVPLDKFPCPVPSALVFDILGKRVGGRVTLLWRLAEGLESDAVEVSLQCPGEFPIFSRLAPPYRVGAENRLFQLTSEAPAEWPRVPDRGSPATRRGTSSGKSSH